MAKAQVLWADPNALVLLSRHMLLSQPRTHEICIRNDGLDSNGMLNAGRVHGVGFQAAATSLMYAAPSGSPSQLPSSSSSSESGRYTTDGNEYMYASNLDRTDGEYMYTDGGTMEQRAAVAKSAKSIVDADGSEVLASWAISRGVDANGNVRSFPQVDASGGRGVPVDDDDDDDETIMAKIMSFSGGGAVGKCKCRKCEFPVFQGDTGWCDFCFGGVGGQCTCDCAGCEVDNNHESGECSHAAVRMLAKSAARSGKSPKK